MAHFYSISVAFNFNEADYHKRHYIPKRNNSLHFEVRPITIYADFIAQLVQIEDNSLSIFTSYPVTFHSLLLLHSDLDSQSW